MAESESGADKSEEPTSKRLEESRKKGQIARSRELNTVVVTMAGIVGLLVYGADFGQTLLELMTGNFALARDVLLDDRSMALYLLASGKLALEAMLPLLVVLLIAAVLGPIGLGGWLFSPEAMAPKASRMNPAAGLKRMFSNHALVELLKALAPETA